ncbi:Gfo/Idh/MocA family protein [Humibacillus xanthopallidus]|uniref:Gfo/Idh/MocA family protein n=1 Tax=Humibacillus xanthopallidus TaxID=412689 RepID=UPI00384C41F2
MTATVVVRGSGSIGQRHARVFRRLGADVHLWPVRPRASRGVDEDTGARLVDDATVAAVLTSADLVVVATDTGRHVEDTVALLDAGVARVLLEKPVAPTVADAARLAAHARSGDVWVAAPLRANAAFRHLLSCVAEVGTPASAHVWSQSWLPDWRPDRDYRDSYSARLDEGGVLRDLVHELDYAALLLGRPSLLGAHLDRTGPLSIAAEQAATMLWTTPDGSVVTARLDYITRPQTRGLVLRGTSGGLEWHLGTAVVRHISARGDVTELAFPEDLDRDVVMGIQARAALDLHPSADAVAAHSAGAPATLAEGLATLELCDAARALSDSRATTPSEENR